MAPLPVASVNLPPVAPVNLPTALDSEPPDPMPLLEQSEPPPATSVPPTAADDQAVLLPLALASDLPPVIPQADVFFPVPIYEVALPDPQTHLLLCPLVVSTIESVPVDRDPLALSDDVDKEFEADTPPSSPICGTSAPTSPLRWSFSLPQQPAASDPIHHPSHMLDSDVIDSSWVTKRK